MIRILHVVSVMDVGGMESFIMNMYRCIDRTAVQFDFLVHHKRRGVFENEIEELGGHVFHTSLMDDGNIFRYKRALKELFKQHNEYRIVHGHLGSTAYFYLGEAKRQGVPWRILHSHCPSHIHTLKGDIKHILFQFSPRNANVYLACSEAAGLYQFRSQHFEIIPNGINVNHFRYDESLRLKIRSELSLTDKYVIGHVGRFYYEKNHAYMLKIFKRIKECIPNAVLMLIGDGSLMEETKEAAALLGLQSDILFMGLQKDTAPYYQAMDAFILPSLYEGLPLVGIEAQCAGLPCLFSDQVSSEVKLSDNCHFLPISEGSESEWASELASIKEMNTGRYPLPTQAKAFDSRQIAGSMVDRYRRLLETHP